MKLKGIILAVIISLASIMMPFSVYAETIDSHIRGRNYTYEPVIYNEIQVSSNTYYQNIGVFHITFELDDEYIGYVLPNYSIQYDNYFYGAQSPSWGTLTASFDRRVFVNGSSFSFDIPVNWNSININSAPGGEPFNYDSYTISSSDVTKYADIDSLDQIINILQDLYNSNDQVEGLLNDHLTQLQLVVSNTSLANDYLEDISLLRQYNFPIESLNIITNTVKNGNTIVDLFTNGYWKYPVFSSELNRPILQLYGNRSVVYKFILINVGYTGSANALFNLLSTSRGTLSLVREIYGNAYNIRCIEVQWTFSDSGFGNIYFANANTRYIPIVVSDTTGNYKYLSTDFALNWGLSNQLLDDLHIIANGTNQSNSAASDLESGNDQMADDMNDLATIENGYNQQFNNQLQQIDFSSPLQNNAGILPAANFVITIFNGLINNNPFSVLIIIVCILLIGKKVIGK